MGPRRRCCTWPPSYARLKCLKQLVKLHASMHLLFLFASHAVVSSSLTLLNKRIAVTVFQPWTIILLVCSASSLISLLIDLPFKTIKPLRLSQLPGCVAISFLFTLCLVSSISGLHRVHVPMAVVGKNLTPFLTSLLEALVLQAPLHSSTLLALCVGVAGGGIYLVGDANASAIGLLFVIVNATCVAVTAVCEKLVTGQKNQSPHGLGFLRNAMAVPFVAVMLLTDVEASLRSFRVVWDAGAFTWMHILVTAFFSSISGTLLFELQTRVTATTTQVASLCYKLASTTLSLVLFPGSRNDIGGLAILGYALSMVGVGLYSHSRNRMKK